MSIHRHTAQITHIEHCCMQTVHGVSALLGTCCPRKHSPVPHIIIPSHSDHHYSLMEGPLLLTMAAWKQLIPVLPDLCATYTGQKLRHIYMCLSATCLEYYRKNVITGSGTLSIAVVNCGSILFQLTVKALNFDC